jgi:hypothetical protein
MMINRLKVIQITWDINSVETGDFGHAAIEIYL